MDATTMVEVISESTLEMSIPFGLLLRVPINKKEVGIKGRKCQRTNTAMAKAIGIACNWDWVTRVQVIRSQAGSSLYGNCQAGS